MENNYFNNIIREGYYQSNNNKSQPGINATQKRLETDILLNGKKLFEDRNNIVKSLTDENRILKEKVNIVFEKDAEISQLKSEKNNLEIENNSIKEKLKKIEELETKIIKDRYLTNDLYKDNEEKIKMIDKLNMTIKSLKEEIYNLKNENSSDIDNKDTDDKDMDHKDIDDKDMDHKADEENLSNKERLKLTIIKFMDISEDILNSVLEDFEIDDDDLKNEGFISYLLKLVKTNIIDEK